MQILDNIIILSLPVIAFFVGKHISDSYSERQIQELEYQLRLQAAEKGYVQPPLIKRRMPIGQQFMDRLKETGRATTRFSQSDLSK